MHSALPNHGIVILSVCPLTYPFAPIKIPNTQKMEVQVIILSVVQLAILFDHSRLDICMRLGNFTIQFASFESVPPTMQSTTQTKSLMPSWRGVACNNWSTEVSLVAWLAIIADIYIHMRVIFASVINHRTNKVINCFIPQITTQRTCVFPCVCFIDNSSMIGYEVTIIPN